MVLNTNQSISRLTLEELEPGLAESLRPRIERLGYLGEFFRCCGHQPAALRSFMAFTDDLKAALPEDITEVVALVVATRLENAYERHQHERLSLKLGFSREWVAAVQHGTPDDPLLTPAQQAVARFVAAAVARGGRGTSAELAAVVDALGPEAAVAVMLLVGRYTTHAMVVNALELAPPVASIFEDAARP